MIQTTMKAHAHGFGDRTQTDSKMSGLQTIRGILTKARREREHIQESYKNLGYIFDPQQILKTAKELVQLTAAVLREQKETFIQAVARQLRLQTAYVIDVKGRKDADEEDEDDDDNTIQEASPERDATGDKTSNLHILLSSAVLEVPTIDFVDYTDTDRKSDQQLATFTLQLLLRFEICSVLRKSGNKEFGLGRHRDLTRNIAYSLAEHLRDHDFEPKFFNEILKANYGKDSADLSDFRSIFLRPEESTSEDEEQPPHKSTAPKHKHRATVVVTNNPKATGGQQPAATHKHRATVVVTKNPKATGGQQPAALFSGIPQGAPRHQQMGTKMLEDKRLGAVLFKGPNASDKAAGSSRTAGWQRHASQQDEQLEGSTNPSRRGSKRRVGQGTPQSRRKRTPPEREEINEDEDEDAIPGTVPPKQPPHMPRFSGMPDDMQQPSASKAAKSLFEALVSEPLAPRNQEKNVRKTTTWLRDATFRRPPSMPQRQDANLSNYWLRNGATQPPQQQLQAEQTDANPWAWAQLMPQPRTLLAPAAQGPSTRQGAASQASRRGPTLLDILEEKLQQLNEPLPGMDEDDAPVQNKDCAKPQGEDGGPGAEAGDDDDHHADVPSSPPSHAHLPELSVVPDTPLDGEPGDTENSRGEEAGFKPLEGDSQHNASREQPAATSSQPAQAGGRKSHPRRSRKTTKGVTPQLQLADEPVPRAKGPAQQPQPCTAAAAGKRKREAAAASNKRSKRNKAEKPKDCDSGPTQSAQAACPALARVTRSAAAWQTEPSSRPVTRSQGRAGQSDRPAAQQPVPSSSRRTRLQGRAEQAPLAPANAPPVASDSEATGESKRRGRKRGEAGTAAAASSAAQQRLPRKPAARNAPAPSRSSQPSPDAAGEVRGVGIVDNPLRRLSTIAEASQEEEEAAAVATGPPGGAPADLISPGTAAATATLASMRRPSEAPPAAQERKGWRGGFRRPNWAALGDLTPPNPLASSAGAEGGARRSKRLAEQPAGEAVAKRARRAWQEASEGEAPPPPRRSGRQTRPSRGHA